jgi:hypothetical protein
MPSAAVVRTFLAASMLALAPALVAPVRAQQAAKPAAAAPAKVGALPTLPGWHVTMEVDAREDDLLGLVKQIDLQGIPLAEALGTITHLRVVTYEPPKGPDAVRPAGSESASAFFEKAFVREGARRTFLQDRSGNRTVVLTFDRPQKQIAVIFEKPDGVTVARADGYPDLQKISVFLNRFLPGIGVTPGASPASAAGQ